MLRQLSVVYVIVSIILAIAFGLAGAYGAAVFTGLCAVIFPAIWIMIVRDGPLW
jgi:hypothetical protein